MPLAHHFRQRQIVVLQPALAQACLFLCAQLHARQEGWPAVNQSSSHFGHDLLHRDQDASAASCPWIRMHPVFAERVMPLNMPLLWYLRPALGSDMRQM